MGFDISGVSLTSSAGTLSMDAASNWMKVNPTGILTRPQTPYMRGQFTGLSNPYNNSGAALRVTADVNIGSCWNNSTGLFTAPVAGYYLMTSGAIASASSGYFEMRKNNAAQVFTHWNHASSWHFVSLHGIVLAAVNDYFSWHITSPNPATAGFYGGGNHCMFSITLMA